MGRAQKKSEAGSAGRLAAGRRPSRGVEKKPSAGLKKRKQAAAASGAASLVARVFKLVVLLGLMALIGFAGVLVLDVGSNLLGSLRFGDTTFADVANKVKDRMLDRDVPEPKKQKQKQTVAAPSAPAPAAPPSTNRAPAKAPAPEDYARHLKPKPDKDVEQAKQRLDDLLNKL